jgi:thioredoxin reductase (NADPH)
MEAERTEVLLVGAGPVGIEVAWALKRARIPCIHVDSGQIGQTITWFAPGTRFFSSSDRIAICGVPISPVTQEKTSREEYLAYLRQVVTLLDLPVRTFEKVCTVRRDSEGFETTTESRRGHGRVRSRYVVLATGGTDYPNYLNIPGEDLPHVSHYLADPHLYFRQRLLVVGGRNSAAEALVRCHRAGARVILSYRGRELPVGHIKYWLMPELNGLIRSGAIEAHFNTVPVSIDRQRVQLARPDGAPAGQVEADFVLLLTGYAQDNTLLRAAGVDLHGANLAPRFDPETLETNVPGLFVAGTASAGTQHGYRVFIENCHDHGDRIVAAITGGTAPLASAGYAEPES